MTDHQPPVKTGSWAPLKNVAAGLDVAGRIMKRPVGVDGLGVFFGPSGYGKSKTCTFLQLKFNAVYLEVFDFWTRRQFVSNLLRELGVDAPRGTIGDMMQRAIELLAYDPDRLMIIDEADTRVMGDWGTMLAIVESVKPLNNRLGNTIAWREWNNAIVPASGESFVELPPSTGTSPIPADRTIAVSGFSITPYSKLSGGASIPYGKATWSAIADPGVDQVMVRVWPVAGSEAADGEDFFASPKLTSSCLVGPLSPLVDYAGYAIPIRKDGRLTVKTNPVFFAAGALVVPTVPGGDSVGVDQLSQEVKGLLRWLGTSSRALIMQLEQTGRLVAEQDISNFETFQQLRRQLSVELGGLTASFNEVIEVALGEGGAIATALSALYAAMGGNSSEVNVRWQAVAAPSGYSARYAVQAAVNDGTFRSATFMLDVPENPAEPTRIILDAGQTLITTDGGATVTAMFDEDGAVIRNLKTGKVIGPNINNGWDLTTGVLRVGRVT